MKYSEVNICSNIDSFLEDLIILSECYINNAKIVSRAENIINIDKCTDIYSIINRKIDSNFQEIIGCGRPSSNSYWSSDAFYKVKDKGIKDNKANNTYTRDHAVPKNILTNYIIFICNKFLESSQVNDEIKLIFLKFKIIDFLLCHYLIVVITLEENKLLNKSRLRDRMPVEWKLGDDIVKIQSTYYMQHIIYHV